MTSKTRVSTIARRLSPVLLTLVALGAPNLSGISHAAPGATVQRNIHAYLQAQFTGGPDSGKGLQGNMNLQVAGDGRATGDLVVDPGSRSLLPAGMVLLVRGTLSTAGTARAVHLTFSDGRAQVMSLATAAASGGATAARLSALSAGKSTVLLQGPRPGDAASIVICIGVRTPDGGCKGIYIGNSTK